MKVSAPVLTIIDLIMLEYDEDGISVERLAELEAALIWINKRREEE